MTDKPKTLAEALLEAQREMKNPAKSHTAEVPTKSGGKFTYTYASLDDTVTEAKTVLNAVNIVLLQPMVSDQFTVGVRTELRGYGEVLDLGTLVMPTNPDPQKVGAIVTYLRRYALGALGLVAEDDTDGAGVDEKPAAKTEGRTYGKSEPPADEKPKAVKNPEGPPSAAQLDFIRSLVEKRDKPATWIPSDLKKGEASDLITALKDGSEDVWLAARELDGEPIPF